MTVADRKKLTALQNGLNSIDAYEQRILADMRNAGWRFRSVAAARRHFVTLQAITRFNIDQDADALALALSPRRTAWAEKFDSRS